MLLALALTISLLTSPGPLGGALEATEAPPTLRAAFTVELKSEQARRVYTFDPRVKGSGRWALIEWDGEDDELDAAGRDWSQEAAPDGRLFPKRMRESLGTEVEAEELGAAWRVHFRYVPQAGDSDVDVWAAERLHATAWLDPASERFLRLDYSLVEPTRWLEGGTVTRYNQSFFLETEPRWGMTYVSGYQLSMEGRAGFHRIERSYAARVTNVEFFFATPQAQTAFEAERGLGGAPVGFEEGLVSTGLDGVQ